jgi:NADH:ubiquinone oxidoreductase subunit 4 (subunit M)
MVTAVLILQFLALLGALLIWIFLRRNAQAAGVLALLFALAQFVFTVVMLILTPAATAFSLNVGLDLAFQLDSLAGIALLVISGATAIAILYSFRAKQTPARTPSFYALILLVLFGTSGVALARDLIQFYIFWEAVLMLASILWIVALAGTGNMDALAGFLPTLPAGTLTAMAALFLMGFIVKLAIFPFHTWLPDAYTSAVMPVTLMLVGVMTNIGIYGVARFLPFFPATGTVPLSLPLLIAAVVTMFYGGAMALAEKNIKRVVAYSSISQMGYVLFGFATLLPLGFSGSVFNLFNQAATKLALFIALGMVAEQAGTYQIDALGGWAKRLPLAGVVATAAMLSLVGAPPALGFWPEFLTFSAGFQTGQTAITILALVATVLSAAYALRLIRFTFFGPLTAKAEGPLLRPAWTGSLALLLCFLVLLVFGVYPAPAFELVRQALSFIGFGLGG